MVGRAAPPVVSAVLAAYYLQVFGRVADFDGRSRRAELAAFAAVHAAVTAVLVAASVGAGRALGLPWIVGGSVVALYLVVAFVPALAAAARRLHDTGRSSLLLALVAVPPLGLLLLWWLALPGEPGPNRWGRDPRSRPPGDYDGL